MLYFFDSDFDSRLAGNKAGNLQQLFTAGFPAPNGFVIPCTENIARLSDETLLSAIDRVGGFPVAVRSSGAFEDMDGASFAGQYKTFLMVDGVTDLRARILECRDSEKSDLVCAYLKKKGISATDASVSVLIQPMIQAVHAGVGFSIDPISGKEEHGLVECCEGLGEHLVSGTVTPSRYVIDLFDGRIIEFAKGENKTEPKEHVFRELRDLLLRTQAHFGKPQDIEWAVDAQDRVWLLQSRPITQSEIRKVDEEWTNADFKDGGVSARICTPMMYSLYRNAMQLSMQEYIIDLGLLPKNSKQREWIGFFYGRPYWNSSTVKRLLSKVPGFDEESFDKDLGIQKAYGEKGPVKTPTNPRTILSAIPIALNLLRQYREMLKFGHDYGKGFLVRELKWRNRTAAFSRTKDAEFFQDLKTVINGFHLDTESSYFRTIYCNSNIQSDFKKLIASIDVATGGSTALLKLMCGLDEISHIEIQREIYGLYQIASQHGLDGAEWTEALREFMDKMYYHADSELDLVCPRWEEIPERIVEMVREMRSTGITPANPANTAVSQKNEYEEEVQAVLRRIRSRWTWRLRFAGTFQKRLKRMRAYLTLRERMRDYSTRCYAIVRPYVVEAGRRLTAMGILADPFEIFMLQTEDLTRLCVGDRGEDLQREIRRKVNYRLMMYRGYRDFTPPNEFGLGITQTPPLSLENMTDGSGELILTGLGCSPGVVRGRARVIRTVQEMNQIQKGEILVTRFTDPGWTPVLGVAAGVITEVGGVLSHAAVISRELGIPAILNMPGITTLIDGKEIIVDGTRGTVQILTA